MNDLLQRDARGEHVVEYRIAAVYEVLGERDEAFRWLDKDVDDRDGLGSWLSVAELRSGVECRAQGSAIQGDTEAGWLVRSM